MPSRTLITLIGLTLLVAAAVLLRLLVGDPGGLHFPENPEIWALRFRPAVAGLTVGAALAVAGVFLQSLLRNPLAAPELLGLGSGASLAATVAAFLAYRAGVPAGSLGIALGGPAALAGALGALTVVYLLAQRRGLVDPVSLILIGVIVSIICGAATTFVAYLLPPEHRFGLARWTVGALSDETTSTQLVVAGVIAAGGLALGVPLGRAMDAASLGEDEARSVGVRVGALRLVLFVASGVLTAAAVVIAGPVSFIGLVAPHAVRLLAGPAHGPLVVGAALAGAGLVVGADAAVQLIDVGAGRMPLGVLTALVGGPVFIWLLRREAGSGLR